MAIEKTINLNVNTKGAQKEVKDLEKAVEGVNEEVKETSASTEAMGGALDNATGGAITKFKGLKSGLGSLIKSFKSLRVAIIGTGIGALLIAVTSLTQAFSRSEEGQNKLSKVLGILGSVVDNVLDGFANLGEGIISAFENPQQAWDNFKESLNNGWQFIKNQIIDRFQGGWAVLSGRVQSGILKMRIAWNEFTGDAEEAETLKAELEEVNQKVVEGVEQITRANQGLVKIYESAKDKIKEFTDEVAKDAAQAGRIADIRAKADRLERKLIVDRAKADRDRATLLEQSVNKEKFSVEERIGFLQEAADLEEKITNQEIEAAEKRLEAQRAENALGKSTKEDKEKEAQLEAQLIQLETAKLTKQKEVTSQIIAFKAEEAAQLKAIADQQAAEDKERADQKAADDKARKDKEAEEAKDRKEKQIEVDRIVGEAQQQIQLAQLNNAQRGFQLLSSLAGKNKGLQAAAIIGENAVGIAKQVISTQAANRAVDLKYALIPGGVALAAAEKTINKVSLGIGVASSVAATAKALSALKSGGSAAGAGVGAATGGGGTEPQAPSFNIVGASDTNQLADAIGGQTQQPVQAYVVANDVTTAQSLENNIVEGATLG